MILDIPEPDPIPAWCGVASTTTAASNTCLIVVIAQ